jgi:hypothetical protein
MAPKRSDKKSKKDDPASDEEEPEKVVDEEEENEEAGGEDEVDDDVSDAGDESPKTKSGRPSKKMSKEDREKNRASRRRAVAKRKGYRLRAVKAGYGAGKASCGGAARDVASNIVSIPETIRACKWAPKMRSNPTYANLSEFQERTELSIEPLPNGAAEVIRASGEAFLRKIVDEAILRSFEAGRPRVTAATLFSVLRAPSSALRFSIGMPQGLVRYAQTKTINASGVDSNAIGFFEGDDKLVREEAKMLPKQEAIGKEIDAKEQQRKAERAKKRAAAADGAETDKRAKRAAAA